MLFQSPEQIPYPFSPSQLHLSMFTGSAYTVSVYRCYLLNQNVALRLLSRGLVSNHQIA
jgi:hypothetical protein